MRIEVSRSSCKVAIGDRLLFDMPLSQAVASRVRASLASIRSELGPLQVQSRLRQLVHFVDHEIPLRDQQPELGFDQGHL